MSIIERLLSLFGRRGEPQITHDDIGVTVTRPNGAVEHVDWADLVEVAILTTDEGPFVEDVFFLLIGAFDEAGQPKSGVALDHGAVQGPILDRLLALPGFDHEAFIQAMGSASNATFVCWRRDASLTAA